MSESLGAYLLEPASRESDDFAWHAASRGDGRGPPLAAKIARTKLAAAALAREARHCARLSELAPAVLRPVDWVALGDRQALISVAVEGEPLGDEPLDLAATLAVADALANLDQTLATHGLAFEPSREDLLVAPAGRGVWVTGLDRLAPSLGADARHASRAWGRLIAELLGAPETEDGFDLEAVARRVPPILLGVVRSALDGRGYPTELIGELKDDADEAPALALRARRAAAFGLLDTVSGPHGPLYLACREGDGWLAIDPRLDAVVRLGAEATWATQLPEPVVLPPAPPLPLTTPEAPPKLVLRRRPEGTVLQLADLAQYTDAVLLVRRRREGALLLPEDGQLVATLEAEQLEEPFVDTDAAKGDRYAAFPLFGGVPSPPARASL